MQPADNHNILKRKMSKKKLVTIAVIVVILVASIAIIIARNKKGTVQTFSPVPYSSNIPKAQLKVPTGDTMNVGGETVNNVYKNSPETSKYGDAYFVENDSYSISYILQGQYFQIYIQGSPFKDVRKEAEADLLKQLGVSQEEACKLDVRITTPAFANPNEAGTTYKLSFCQ